MHRIAALALVGVLLATAANAQDCTHSTTNDCAEAAYNAANKELNLTYSTLVEHLKSFDQRRKLLISSQQEWGDFLVSECEFATSFAKVEGEHIKIYNQCAQRMSEARTAQLKNYLRCEEGGESCRAQTP